MNKLFDYIKNLRYVYWKRRLEGNWYFSDAVYYRDAKKIQRDTIVNRRKWNLVLSPDSYVMYGDAPLTVASIVTMTGGANRMIDFLGSLCNISILLLLLLLVIVGCCDGANLYCCFDVVV